MHNGKGGRSERLRFIFGNDWCFFDAAVRDKRRLPYTASIQDNLPISATLLRISFNELMNFRQEQGDKRASHF